MGQPIKLIIKKGAVRKDGTSLIFLQYCHTAEQRILLSTDVPIPPNCWNKKTGRIAENLPSKYGNVNELQLSITAKLRKAEDMVEYAVKKRNTCPMQFLKENFLLQTNWKLKQMSDSAKSLDIYWNIDDYAESKKSTVKHFTINVINAMKAHLKSFESFRKEVITFDSFDMNFYEEFVKYLTYDIIQLRRKEIIKGLKVNSIGKTIKHLKSFLRDRMRKKIIPFMDLGAYKGMEEMLQMMNDKQEADPEMQQLNGTLEKILDIQHPQRVKDKLKEKSLQQKDVVFAVKKSPMRDNISLLDTSKHKAEMSTGFYGIGDNKNLPEEDNAVEAVVHANQTLVNGAVIKLRLATDIYISGILIPKGTFVYGIASLYDERLEIEINSIRNGNSLFPVKLEVYDIDGLPGIHIPGAITRDVAKQSADNGLQLMELTSVDPSLKAQAAAAGISTVKTLLSRKVKQVKVMVKAGYKVLLKSKNIQQ